jgi:hypothetical protein
MTFEENDYFISNLLAHAHISKNKLYVIVYEAHFILLVKIFDCQCSTNITFI